MAPFGLLLDSDFAPASEVKILWSIPPFPQHIDESPGDIIIFTELSHIVDSAGISADGILICHGYVRLSKVVDAFYDLVV